MNLQCDGEGFVFTAVVVLNWEKELSGVEISVNGYFQAEIEWRVDKVLGFWKAEWINRKKGEFGAAEFTRWILQYGFSGRFDLEKQPQNGKKKGTRIKTQVPYGK